MKYFTNKLNKSLKTVTLSLVTLGLSTSLSYAAVNYPFPQSSNYNGNGITVSNPSAAATNLKAAFKHYYDTFYNESGSYAGIRSNQGSNEYFSEGIGYGMLLMVYFSDNTKSYQPEFDKLWAFYKASLDSNGLMNWKMGNLDPSAVWGKGAATDAEVDVAAALIMASKQFGNSNYATEAATLLAKVRKFEFESNGLHRPGDFWNDKKNPSYVTPAYYVLYKDFDTQGASFWETALSANYTLLEKNSSEFSTGLFDNWSDASGIGLDKYYGYDASRAPWRLAQAYYWYGDTRAQTMLNKIATWLSTKSASSVSGSIHRSGTMGSDHNSTFVATLMTSFITSSTHQSKLDEFWNEAVALGNENYFNQSLRLLSGLTVTGNMPNFVNSSTTISQSKSPLTQDMSVQNNHLIISGLTPKMTRISLLDLQGKHLNNLYNSTASAQLRLSLQGYKMGVYIVKVQQESSIITHKINIQ